MQPTHRFTVRTTTLKTLALVIMSVCFAWTVQAQTNSAGLAAKALTPTAQAPLLLNTTSFGTWSDPTNGLRARLAFGEGDRLFGTRQGVIYLELQNISLGDTMYVYYRAASSPFRCQLLDSASKPIPASGTEYDGWIPEGCWLALPYDSTLRFRVTLGGFGIPQNGGLVIAGCFPDFWVIPPNATNDYYLSAALTIAVPKDETRPRSWEGTLKLPQVRIPVRQQP